MSISLKSRVLPVLLTYWLLIKFPTTPASGLVNFLELVTELRKTVHLLDDWFIRKETTQKEPDGRDAGSKV